MEARFGIITVSDTRTFETDTSGPAAIDALKKLGFTHFEHRLVRDDLEAIQAAILDLCASCRAIFTSGGTGFSPRDVTPEATRPLLDRTAESISELIRLRGLEHTPLSHLSRGIAGIRGSVLIVNLPGSAPATRQGIEAIAPLLTPILASLVGDGCPHA